MSAIPVEVATALRRAHERESQNAEAADDDDALSPAEDRVLRLLATGHANRGIAAANDVSVDTVKTQLRSVYRKLGARSRAHAVHLAHEQGLLP